MGVHFGGGSCSEFDGVTGVHEDNLQTVSGLLERYQALRDLLSENDCHASILPKETDITNVLAKYEEHVSYHDKQVITELLDTIHEIERILSNRLKFVLDSHYKMVRTFVYDYENSKKPFEILKDIKDDINSYTFYPYTHGGDGNEKNNTCDDIVKIIDDYIITFSNGMECMRNGCCS